MLDAELRLSRPGFDLDVRLKCASGVLGVMGPSGAGKSTLLHALAGLIRPDSGRITLDDRSLFDARRRESMPPHRRHVAIAFQDDRLWPHQSVRGNMLYGFRRVTGRPRRVVPDQVVDALELAPLLGRRVTNLSGGERKRVGLARALLANARLLLLDEPTSGLDQRMRDRVLELIGNIVSSERIPAVLVSHYPEDIFRLTDRVLLLAAGRSVFEQQSPTASGLAALPSDALGVNRLCCRVQRHDAAAGMTRLLAHDVFQGQPVEVRCTLHSEFVPDQPVVALLPADQVVLAMAPVETVSMQNQLRGRVLDLVPQGDSVLCVVDAGVRMSAKITRQAQIDFQVRPGAKVWCLFKASALKVYPRVAARSEYDPGIASDSCRFVEPRTLQTHEHVAEPLDTRPFGCVNAVLLDRRN